MLINLSSIYNLEKSIHQSADPASRDPEASPLLTGDEPDISFQRALDVELERVTSFYQLKEPEIYGEVDATIREHEDFESGADGYDAELWENRGGGHHGRSRAGAVFRNLGFGRRRRGSTLSASITEADEDADSDDDGDESTAFSGLTRKRSRPLDTSQNLDDMRSSRELPNPKRRYSQTQDDHSDYNSTALYNSSSTLKKRTIGVYVSLCELKSFIHLNQTGFSKALKKYDKIMNRNLRSSYMKARVTPAYPFQESTMEQLDANTTKIEKRYADLMTKGDIALARRELRLHLREHVVWERNTVWREMIGIERKAEAATMGLRRTLLGGDHAHSKARLQGDQEVGEETKELNTPVGRFRCPSWLFSSTFFFLIAIIAIFAVLLTVPIMKTPEQQNCLAMLVFVSLLWATEVSRRRQKLDIEMTNVV